MSSTLKNKFEELNMTQDEINRFTEAMKKEEFRKLLIEYAEEISDPKNRELYEQEIIKLEEERGMEAIFIHPEPGYCILTFQDKKKKCYINICKNSNIHKPAAERDYNNNRGGLNWKIPHSCTSAREDIDKSNKETCVVYDVVFHPDTYRMGETSQRFNELLKDSAMDTIEKNFNVILDRKNSKILKDINFKGKPTASVIRKPKNDIPLHSNEEIISSRNPIEKMVDQLKIEYLNDQTHKNKKDIEQDNSIKFIEPIYKIIYSGKADIQDYVNMISKNTVENTRPREIKIKIELPLCKSSSDVILDIFENRLYLESQNPFYKLELNLSYPVNEKEAKAKFDKSKKILNVILPIKPSNISIKENFNQLGESNEEKSNLIHASSDTSLLFSPFKETEIEIIQDVKYLIPSDFKIVEFIDTLKISIFQENFNEDSIRIQLINKNTLVLYYECISQSGNYITYYRAYFNFFKNNNFYSLENSKFGQYLNNFKITALKNKFEIDFPKNNDDDETITCLISSTEIKEFKRCIDTESESFEIYNVKKELINKDNSNCNDDLSISQCNKELIMNFSKNLESADSDDENNLNFEVKNNEEEKINNLAYLENSNDKRADISCSSSFINSNGLKSILKKNRSISEGEVSIRSSIESNSNEGSQEICLIKKSVSFSKQVVRNIFKPGSTISGMKKPNSSKNKKKNQKRNRTLSDPCHSNDQISNDLIQHHIKFRQRGFSESSDDVSNSTDFVSESEILPNNQSKRKNKKLKKKIQINDEKFEFELENRGEKPFFDQYEHKTDCAFKLKNRIVEDLD